MSRLYPDRKPPKPKVRCMDCDNFDMPDLWCPIGKKDIQDLYEMRRCRWFVKIKGVVNP